MHGGDMTHATPESSTVDTFHLTRAQMMVDLLRTLNYPGEPWMNHPDRELYATDNTGSVANGREAPLMPYAAVQMALKFALRRLVETDEHADRLYEGIIDNGEDVEWNVRVLSQEIRWEAEEAARDAAEDAAYWAGVRAGELVAGAALGTAPSDAEPSPDGVVVRDPLLDLLDQVADERPAADVAPDIMRHVMGAEWLGDITRGTYGTDGDQS
jgi:hypothetical protein